MATLDHPTAVLCPKCGHTLRRIITTHYPETDQLKCKHCDYNQKLRIEITEFTHLQQSTDIIQEAIDQLETLVANLAYDTLEI